jgi:hypothetical protein
MACGWGHENDFSLVRDFFQALASREEFELFKLLDERATWDTPMGHGRVQGAAEVVGSAFGWRGMRKAADLRLLATGGGEGTVFALVLDERSPRDLWLEVIRIKRNRITEWSSIFLTPGGDIP